MLEDSGEAFVEEAAELEEGFGVHSSENLNIVRYKFEGDWSLKFDSFPWGVREKESEIYVHYMSISSNEDISVVSIFYL